MRTAVTMASEADLELLDMGAKVRGRYEVVRRLRAGGMGAVYEVLDRETHRRRALKTLLPSFVADRDLCERFQLEIRVAANVESEHVVEVFDAGVDDTSGLPFFVMELLKGETLADTLATRRRLTPAEVMPILFQASLALDRTHAAGIVHRDLKPENLFVTRRDDGSPRLKLLDFGIAKIASQATQPNTTRNLGTPLYMSPEQIRGDGAIGPTADLYSLGQIAYSLLVGAPYWLEESAVPGGLYALLMKVTDGAVEPASARAARAGAALPAGFDAWFRRATARRPLDRFGTASELVDALGRVLEVAVPRVTSPALVAAAYPAPARTGFGSGGDSMGALATAPPVPRSRSSSRWLRSGALITVGALLAGVLSYGLRPTPGATPAAPVVTPSVVLAPSAATSPVAPVIAPSASLLGPESSPSAGPVTAAPPAPRISRPTVKPRPAPAMAPKRYDPTDLR